MRLNPTISLFKPAAAVLALGLWLALLLPSLERNRLQDVDELWHARAAQGAVLEGHWWPLMLDGRPFFEKPPLMPWLAAVTVTLSGQVRAAWPYRLWNTLAGALLLTCVIGLAALAGRYWGGLFAACLLGLQGDFVFHSRFFSMDTPFLGLAFAAALSVAWALGSPRRPWAWVLAGACLGLAFWCKSWFVLALAPAFGAALWAAVPSGQRGSPAWNLVWPLAISILLWLALYTSWSGPHFLRQEWQENVLGRLSPGVGQTLADHLRFYPVWAQRSAPAMLVLALGVILGLSPRRQGDPAAHFVRVFAWSLALSWFVGLAVVPAETINYLLPLEAALALAFGSALLDPAGAGEQRLLTLLCLAAAFTMQRVGSPWWGLWAGLVLGMGLAWLRWRRAPAAAQPRELSLVAAAALLLLLQVPDAYLLCARPLDSHRHLAALLEACPPDKPGETLWAVQIPSRAVDFYSPYKVQHIDSPATAVRGDALLYLGHDGLLHFVPGHGHPSSIQAQ